MTSASKSKAKTRYHHGDLKPALIEIASAQVQQSGHEALTLRAVAQQARVSQTAIYRHFANKEHLLSAVVIDGLQRLQRQTAQALDSDCTPLQRFHQVGKAYVQFAQDNARLYRLMFDAKILSERCSELTEASEQAYGVLKTVIRQCQEHGCLRRDDVDRQAFSVWAAVHGIVTLCRDQAPSVAPQATPEIGFQMIWETCLKGLLANPQQTDLPGL